MNVASKESVTTLIFMIVYDEIFIRKYGLCLSIFSQLHNNIKTRSLSIKKSTIAFNPAIVENTKDLLPLNFQSELNFLTLLHIISYISHIHLAIIINFSAIIVYTPSGDLRTRKWSSNVPITIGVDLIFKKWYFSFYCVPFLFY